MIFLINMRNIQTQLVNPFCTGDITKSALSNLLPVTENLITAQVSGSILNLVTPLLDLILLF